MREISSLFRSAAFGSVCLAIVSATAQQSTPVAPTPIPPVTLPPTPPAAPAPATPAPAAAPATYTVQSGDNPWTIAKKLGVSNEELLKINDIKDPKNLKAGDVLKIPGKTVAAGGEAKPAAPAPAPAATEPAGADWEWYTIAKGDNPWKIAKARGIEHAKIMKLNEGTDFTKLAIGQKIKVPKKK